MLAEDPRLASLVANCLRRAQELVEQRCSLEAQVWLTGTAAIVERRLGERVAASQLQEERISALVNELGNDGPVKDLARLFIRAAALQPDVTSRLLDITESALRGSE